MASSAPDLLRLSATELQSLLQRGELTSVQLVRANLAQISRFDRVDLKLRAVISTPTTESVEAIARTLDEERSQGNLRGPFHGLPIIVKDSINTAPSLGMKTTVGSYAFDKSMPRKSASVIDKLISRGLIIIGKANLTELGNFKGNNLTSGWSALSGQTQSAYVKDGVKRREMRLGHSAPGGSSSGSAVGVSAGYASLSLGTEADGSLVTPASRAALFGIKPTVGSTAMDGIFVISRFFDTVGAMAKSVADLAILTEDILTPEARSTFPSDGFQSSLGKGWSGLRLGFLEPADWTLPPALVEPNKQVHMETREAIEAVIDRVKAAGAEVVYPVKIPHPLEVDMFQTMSQVMNYEARSVIEAYFGTRDDKKMAKVEDLIRFNEEHSELELPEDYPNQALLRGAVEHQVTSAQYEAAKSRLRELALEQGIRETLQEHNLHAILGPTDSPLASVAASAGAPIATVPLGLLKLNGRPFGLSITSLPGNEEILFRIMDCYETTFPPRKVPSLLDDPHTASSL